MKFSFVELIILIILFLVLHVLKFIRIYFILLEEKIPLGRIIKIYIKSTFVSIVLPFKIGAVKMASDTNSPIVPFTINGKYVPFKSNVEIALQKSIYPKSDDLNLENENLRDIIYNNLKM